jgi:hypothetical protein
LICLCRAAFVQRGFFLRHQGSCCRCSKPALDKLRIT